MPRFNDLANKVFGRLTVLYRDPNYKGKSTKFVCQCECGTIKSVLSSLLTRQKAISCGCYRTERRTKHGYSRIINGKQAPEYKAWEGMKARCFNKNDMRYKYYGERGITVCPEWKNSFERFIQDVGNRPSDLHSLDRIDVNDDYKPSNVRWATKAEQSRNRRTVIELQHTINKLREELEHTKAELIKNVSTF